MVTIIRSAHIDIKPSQAWALIRDFNAMPAWNDTVRESRIEDGPADRVGCRRVLVFDDGGIWTHQLTGLSDADMKLQYSIVGSPQPMRIPVWNYRAELRVIPGKGSAPTTTENACTVEWRADFETGHVEEMTLRAGQVFDRGLVGLRARLQT
ncbi:MAG: hypothetical protein CVU24_01400 [Betaproteobacteria bacterium HGW-Betaproteobacteria-18]|nr:MAG: hypothetical protein CVU24_01400 [Betaproteobacteria bacterium HGW-Betaproteobacteria-18]